MRSGDLMYVSFSAGSIMAGLNVQIHTTDTPHKLAKCRCPGLAKDGFALVPYAPGHTIRAHSKAAGKAFEDDVKGTHQRR